MMEIVDSAETKGPGALSSADRDKRQRQATEFAIYQALETVVDPEIGMNVVELALIREIVLAPGSTEIRMILTTPFCPYAGTMIAEVKAAVETVVDHPVKVTLLAEAWDPREAGLVW